MGWNTVAFISNDMCHELEKSPKTVAWMLAHPPQFGDVDPDGDRPRDGKDFWWRQVDSVAVSNDEPRVSSQTLRLLPTFHADHFQWLATGWNGITPLKFMRFGTSDGGKRLTVTLELPEDFPTHPKNRKKYAR